MVCRAHVRRAKANVNQVRPVTDDDIGLKVLREAPKADQSIEYCRKTLHFLKLY